MEANNPGVKTESKLSSIISRLKKMNNHQHSLISEISESLSHAMIFSYGEVRDIANAMVEKIPQCHIDEIYVELKTLEDNNEKLEKIRDAMRELI